MPVSCLPNRARCAGRGGCPAGSGDRYPPPAPELDIYFDLAELRGYHYHTGIVFAAYVPGHGQALANGGRYNDVGAVFGRARPATGFATDLKALMALLPASDGSGRHQHARCR